MTTRSPDENPSVACIVADGWLATSRPPCLVLPAQTARLARTVALLNPSCQESEHHGMSKYPIWATPIR